MKRERLRTFWNMGFYCLTAIVIMSAGTGLVQKIYGSIFKSYSIFLPVSPHMLKRLYYPKLQEMCEFIDILFAAQ